MKCEKIEKQSKIWLWNGIVWGGGSGLFSQWMSCCGQVVERQEGQLIDPSRTRMWPGQPDDRLVRDASRWSTRLPVLRLECNLRCKLLVFRHCHPLVFSPSCREPPKRARCSTTEFGYCAPCFVFVWVFLWICWCWLRSSISSFKPSAQDWFWPGRCLDADALWPASTVGSVWSAVELHNGDGPSPVGVGWKHAHTRSPTHGCYQLYRQCSWPDSL